MSKLGTLKMYLRKTPKAAEQTDLYSHKVTLLDGGELDLSTLRGHPTLIVNTASKCGFTPQYEGLQKLYDTYGSQGLEILGSPSGDFADQEFDTADEIGAFCQRNYGVTFPLTEPTSVRDRPDSLWQDLISQPNSAPPSWNFTKYLVGSDGKLIAHWGTLTTPEDPEVVGAIEAALSSDAN
jgi:glutathione peroxidase